MKLVALAIVVVSAGLGGARAEAQTGGGRARTRIRCAPPRATSVRARSRAAACPARAPSTESLFTWEREPSALVCVVLPGPPPPELADASGRFPGRPSIIEQVLGPGAPGRRARGRGRGGRPPARSARRRRRRRPRLRRRAHGRGWCSWCRVASGRARRCSASRRHRRRSGRRLRCRAPRCTRARPARSALAGHHAPRHLLLGQRAARMRPRTCRSEASTSPSSPTRLRTRGTSARAPRSSAPTRATRPCPCASPSCGAANYGVRLFVVWEGRAHISFHGLDLADEDLGTVTLPEGSPYHVAEIRALLRTTPGRR